VANLGRAFRLAGSELATLVTAEGALGRHDGEEVLVYRLRIERADADPGWGVACLPMRPGERSLNLATAAAIVTYEGVRQCLARGDLALDQRGRIR